MRCVRVFPFAFLITSAAFAQSPEVTFFENNVRPIFAKNCYGCHGPKMQSAGLDLSRSADSVVVKGDPARSRLFQAISYNGELKMPPPGKLSETAIETLRKWIENGAVWPNATVSRSGRQITHEDRQYWAFQPVKETAPASVHDAAWPKGALDQFVLAKLEEKQIRPAKPADRLTLLRRATYDLIGLPPTPEEINSFLADKSPDAFAKVVDRLLASPRYGERWGRHWLDVARYADSTGMDEDHVYPDAWRYRDYVIESFNSDKPYDRFVKEQLAGDLMRQRAIVATGFLALGPKPLAQQDRVQMIYDVVDEQLDTTARAFLGLTIACARCHDHKFDPILTKDYYSLAGIFASTLDFRNLGRPGSVSYIYSAPLDPDAFNRYQAHRWRMYAKQFEMEEALSEDDTREYALLRPKIADFLIAAWKAHATGTKAEGDALKWQLWLESAAEKTRDGYLMKWFQATEVTIAAVAKEYQDTYLKDATAWDGKMQKWRTGYAIEIAEDRDLPVRPKPDPEGAPFFAAATFNGGPLELKDSERVARLRSEWMDLQKTLPPEPQLAAAVTEGIPVDQHVFLHGDHHALGPAVAKTFPVVLAGDLQQPVAQGSGRLELANWIANADNPLTARVMVNRIWQWHFGEALVRTPNNWGKTGDKPSNPELLDYLAKRFVDGGWSIKRLHRMIMLSSTYQMSTEVGKEVREIDPANRLNSRFNRTRMSIEEIRDSMLAIARDLDDTMGGSLLQTGQKGKKFDVDAVNRRTVYIPVRRGSVPSILSSFDFGDATTSSEGRPRTNVAPQALFIMNSRFVVEQSEIIAKHLLDEKGLSDKQRIEKAYLLMLTRRPDSSEIDSGLTYISALERRLGNQGSRLAAWQSFCHVLLATNEFLYLN